MITMITAMPIMITTTMIILKIILMVIIVVHGGNDWKYNINNDVNNDGNDNDGIVMMV